MGNKNRNRPIVTSTQENENTETSVKSEVSVSIPANGDVTNMDTENAIETEQVSTETVVEKQETVISEDTVETNNDTTAVDEKTTIVEDTPVDTTTTEITDPVIIEPVVNNQEKENVSIDPVMEADAQDTPVAVETSIGELQLDDQINAIVKGVPNKSGRGMYFVKDLIRYQMINNAEAQITVISENHKRPFIKLLKTVERVEKLPVIDPSVRSAAIRRFANINKISVIG